MRLSITRLTQAMRRRVDLSNPLSLFSRGEQGAWYDFGNLATLFQDAAGTIPVTAVGQPIGRVLDLSGRGNHLIQPVEASRGYLNARVNDLLSTEAIGNAAHWTLGNTTLAGNTLTENTVNGNHNVHAASANRPSQVTGPLSVSATFGKGTRRHVSLTAANGGNGFYAVLDTQTGLITSSGAKGTGFTYTASSVVPDTLDDAPAWRLEVSGIGNGLIVVAANGEPNGTPAASELGYLGNGSTIIVSKLQLQRIPSRYQRVTSATSYDTVGFPMGLRLDGVDDCMYTAAPVGFSVTDKATVFAGFRKMSDASTGILLELGASTDTAAGTLGLYAPAPDSNVKIRSASRGTATSTSGTSSSAYNAPLALVTTQHLDIAGPTNNLRINGTAVSTVALTQGTGTFSNAVLHIGRRNNESMPLRGTVFSIIVRGAPTVPSQVALLEKYMAGKTGVSL